MPATDLDQIVNLCKRRGFVYPSAEIYGGFRSSYDYGPLGSLMLRNVREAWIRTMVQQRDDVVLIDAAILAPPAVFEASGHLANFSDPLVDCTKCKQRHRQDHLTDPDTCPNCGSVGTLTEARAFNLMFKTFAGPVEGAGAEVYMRPETAQGMFVNFVQRAPDQPQEAAVRHRPGRQELPQRDHSGQLHLPHPRVRADGVRVLRAAGRIGRVVRLLVQGPASTGTSISAFPSRCCDSRPHDADELSHYSAGTADVEFLYPWGWGELEGIAQRTDYDLNQHAEHSGERLDFFDQTTGERYVPYVIEPAAGVNRAMAAFLLAAYDEDVVNDEARSVLRLHPRLAPYKVAVLPLSKKDTLTPLAQDVRAAARPIATWSTTTRPRRSVVATGDRTRSARRCASPSTSNRSTTAPSRCAIATPPSRYGFRSTSCVTVVAQRLGF